MSTQKEREHNSTPYLVAMIASTKHEKENQCPDDDRLSDDVNRISHCLSMIASMNPGETTTANEDEEEEEEEECIHLTLLVTVDGPEWLHRRHPRTLIWVSGKEHKKYLVPWELVSFCARKTRHYSISFFLIIVDQRINVCF
jgi:hypothetical protein